MTFETSNLKQFINTLKQLTIKHNNNEYNFKNYNNTGITLIDKHGQELPIKYNDFSSNQLGGNDNLDTGIFNTSETSDYVPEMKGGNIISETSDYNPIVMKGGNVLSETSDYNPKMMKGGNVLSETSDYNPKMMKGGNVLSETSDYVPEMMKGGNVLSETSDYVPEMTGGNILSETSDYNHNSRGMKNSNSKFNKHIFNSNINNDISLLREKLMELENTTYEPSLQKGGSKKDKRINEEINSTSTMSLCE